MGGGWGKAAASGQACRFGQSNSCQVPELRAIHQIPGCGRVGVRVGDGRGRAIQILKRIPEASGRRMKPQDRFNSHVKGPSLLAPN